MRSNYCEPPLCCTLKITHDVWPDCSDRRRTLATLTRFWRSITDTRPRIWGAGLKLRDYPQQFLDVSPFQALTIEHLSHLRGEITFCDFNILVVARETGHED